LYNNTITKCLNQTINNNSYIQWKIETAYFRIEIEWPMLGISLLLIPDHFKGQCRIKFNETDDIRRWVRKSRQFFNLRILLLITTTTTTMLTPSSIIVIVITITIIIPIDVHNIQNIMLYCNSTIILGTTDNLDGYWPSLDAHLDHGTVRQYHVQIHCPRQHVGRRVFRHRHLQGHRLSEKSKYQTH